MRSRGILGALALASALAAQEVELAGTVHDEAGAPIAGATVAFQALPVTARPTPGTRGRYPLAQAAQRAKSSLPKTRTDRSGNWRILLSPQQAALTDGSGVELALRVTADGCGDWLRGVGTRIAAANGIDAVLPRARPDAPRLRGRVEPAGTRGYALVERVYRARDDASLWLRELVAIDANGAFALDVPARVPGELQATRPSARAEGYRVTIFGAGCEPWQRTLAEGEHAIRLQPSADPPRRVLADRGEPARTPLTVTYQIQGTEVTLELQEARVPLLGGEVPTRVRSASGPVLVDAWDPDAALFVDAALDARAKPAPAAGAATTKPDEPSRTATFTVTDRTDSPLFGAVIWLEDSAARSMSLDPPPFAITDSLGRAQLAGLPAGVFRALVRHATAGEQEVLVDASAAAPIAVTLTPTATPEVVAEPAVSAPASVLFDVGAAAEGERERVEIGVVYSPGRLLVRSFDDHPRLIRVEGLLAGPLPVFARVGAGPLHLLGAVLASDEPRPAVQPMAALEKTFVVEVRTHDDKFEPEVYLSLGEGAPRGRRPYTAAFLPLTYDKEKGEARATLHCAGDVWVRVHGADGRAADLLLPDAPGGPLRVVLPAPAPPPDPKNAEPVKKG